MGEPLRILVVEDDIDAAAVLCNVLVTAGHDVTVAYTCAQGLDAARTRHPDLVLCDLVLPDSDGFTFASAMRNDRAFDDVALVAISGRSPKDVLDHVVATGFDLFVSKPLDLASVRQALRALDIHRASTGKLAP